jgi:hypothetical protein
VTNDSNQNQTSEYQNSDADADRPRLREVPARADEATREEGAPQCGTHPSIDILANLVAHAFTNKETAQHLHEARVPVVGGSRWTEQSVKNLKKWNGIVSPPRTKELLKRKLDCVLLWEMGGVACGLGYDSI